MDRLRDAERAVSDTTRKFEHPVERVSTVNGREGGGDGVDERVESADCQSDCTL